MTKKSALPNGFWGAPKIIVHALGLAAGIVWGEVHSREQMARRISCITVENMALELNLSQGTVRKALKALVRLGYLKDLTPGMRNKAHHYITTRVADVETPIANECARLLAEGVPAEDLPCHGDDVVQAFNPTTGETYTLRGTVYPQYLGGSQTVETAHQTVMPRHQNLMAETSNIDDEEIVLKRQELRDSSEETLHTAAEKPCRSVFSKKDSSRHNLLVDGQGFVLRRVTAKEAAKYPAWTE